MLKYSVYSNFLKYFSLNSVDVKQLLLTVTLIYMCQPLITDSDQNWLNSILCTTVQRSISSKLNSV